jgi:hypothetical protein
MAISGRTVAVLAGITLAGATSVAARDRVVALAPRSAALFAAIGLPVNLDRLEIGPVKATVQSEGPRHALVVETEITNPRGETRTIPPLRLSVHDERGNILYTWTATASVRTIAAGSRVPVRARLASPPNGSDVAVEFVRTPAV